MAIDAENKLLKEQKQKILKKARNALLMKCRSKVENELKNISDENLNDFKEHVLKFKNKILAKIEETFINFEVEPENNSRNNSIKDEEHQLTEKEKENDGQEHQAEATWKFT